MARAISLQTFPVRVVVSYAHGWNRLRLASEIEHLDQGDFSGKEDLLWWYLMLWRVIKSAIPSRSDLLVSFISSLSVVL